MTAPEEARGRCPKCGQVTWYSYERYYFGVAWWCKGCGRKEHVR